MSTAISVLNMKGGVGKTTLSVNLSWYLYEVEKKNVLLVDLDPQFNTTQYIMGFDKFEEHRKSKGTLADLLIEQPVMDLKPRRAKKSKTIGNMLYQVMTDSNTHYFDLLPSELRMAFAVKNPSQIEYVLEKELRLIRDNYDYIFIDCAPTDSALTVVALNASDFVLVPIRPDRFAILGFANFLESLSLFRKRSVNPHNVRELGLVFTQVTGGSDVEAQCMADVRAAAIRERSYVFQSMLGWSKTYIRSVTDQTPAYRTKHAKGKPIANLKAVAAELKRRIDELEK